MTKLLLDSPGNWSVWVGLDDDYEPPAGFSFVIGCGATPEEAIAQAQSELKHAIEKLESRIGELACR